MTHVQPLVAEKDPVLDSPTEVPTCATEGVCVYMMVGKCELSLSTFCISFCRSGSNQHSLEFMQMPEATGNLQYICLNPGYNLVCSMSMGSIILPYSSLLQLCNHMPKANNREFALSHPFMTPVVKMLL